MSNNLGQGIFNFISKTSKTIISSIANHYEDPNPADQFFNSNRFESEETKSESSVNLDDYTLIENIYKTEDLSVFKMENQNSEENPRIVVKHLLETHRSSKKKNFVEENIFLKKIQNFDDGNYYVKCLGFIENEFEFGLKKSKTKVPTTTLILEEGICSLEKINLIRCEKGEHYTESEIFYILEILLKGFSLLQERGFAHCDIKPANILIFKKKINGKIYYHYKISDFGISLDRINEKIDITLLKGASLKYSAPEIPKELFKKSKNNKEPFQKNKDN